MCRNISQFKSLKNYISQALLFMRDNTWLKQLVWDSGWTEWVQHRQRFQVQSKTNYAAGPLKGVVLIKHFSATGCLLLKHWAKKLMFPRSLLVFTVLQWLHLILSSYRNIDWLSFRNGQIDAKSGTGVKWLVSSGESAEHRLNEPQLPTARTHSLSRRWWSASCCEASIYSFTGNKS